MKILNAHKIGSARQASTGDDGGKGGGCLQLAYDFFQSQCLYTGGCG